MHPFVRNLYKRVLTVGRDYPTGIAHVKEKWKKAILDPTNCPSCYCCVDDESNNDNSTKNYISTASNNSTNILHNGVDTTSTGAMNTSKHIVINYKESKQCEEEIFFAVNKGRWFVKEMIGVIKLKKYRTMKQRYGGNNNINIELENAMKSIETKSNHQLQQHLPSTPESRKP
jgi:hypothetical protein